MPRDYKNKPIRELLADSFYHFFDKEGMGAPDSHAYSLLTSWVIDNYEQYVDELVDEKAIKLLFKTVRWGKWDDFQKLCRVINDNARSIGNDLSLDEFEYLTELYWEDRKKAEEHIRKTAELYEAKRSETK